MLYVTEQQAREAVSIEGILPVFRRIYKQCVQGAVQVGPRMVGDLDESGKKGQWLTAIDPEAGFFGSKFSAVFPDNPSRGKPATTSSISLYSMQTGDLVAIVEANALTATKTAASAAIVTDLLARKNASCLVIIGSGLQAFDQVLAIKKVRDVSRVVVYDRDPERASKSVNSLKKTKDCATVSFEVAESANAAVAKADILCTCTTSRKPVFDGSVLKKGTHINAIGSYAPDMQEIDCETVLRAHSIVTEHVDGLWAAAGDILDPLERGLIDRRKVCGSIGDLLSGTVPARVSESSITLYESVGSAVLDLAIAIEAYRKVSQKASM